MRNPQSFEDLPVAADKLVSIDEQLFSKLLILVSTAAVYRRLMDEYLSRQAQYVEQGKTLEELVTDGWQLFEEVARAEARFFRALDDLDGFHQTE